MPTKHAACTFLAILVAVTQLCLPQIAYAHEKTKVVSPIADATYEYGDLVIDALIEQELNGSNLPFAQRELFSLILKTAMRRDMEQPNEYLRQDLIPALLKEELKNRLSPKAERLELIQTIAAMQRIFLQVQLALISRQVMTLEPFKWQTPQELAENLQQIGRTKQQLDSFRNLVRRPLRPDIPPNHLFTLGPAYRQLVDISRNGWDRSLGWDDSILPKPGIMTELDVDAPERDSLTEDFSDIDNDLKDAVASSDDAMQHFHNDMEANGTTKLLQATAQKNEQLTDRMQKMEGETIKANIKALAIGVAVGIAGTAIGMAMQSAPAMRSSYGYGHSTPSSSGVSHATRAIRAPSIGGSFDGAAGQSLYTRF